MKMAESDQPEKREAPSRLAAQADRSLKEAKLLMKDGGPSDAATEQMLRIEEARAYALLDLAQAVRGRK
jgi:hypothetical protein